MTMYLHVTILSVSSSSELHMALMFESLSSSMVYITTKEHGSMLFPPILHQVSPWFLQTAVITSIAKMYINLRDAWIDKDTLAWVGSRFLLQHHGGGCNKMTQPPSNWAAIGFSNLEYGYLDVVEKSELDSFG